MSHSDKSALYRRLKEVGYQFEKPYNQYKTAELEEVAETVEFLPAPPGPAEQPDLQGLPELPEVNREIKSPPVTAAKAPEEELAGERLNTKGEDEIIAVDDKGLAWIQYEIRKPLFARPRARRVIDYVDSGVKTRTVQDGNFIETFEVPGEGRKVSQVKITLPSYQVGIYRDSRYPDFKIHVYNDRRGFDLFDVRKYYGAAELVPAECKLIYVENVLCYDMASVVRAIMTEYRQQQLTATKGR